MLKSHTRFSLLLLSFVTLLLASCSEVHFVHPMPVEATVLDKIPKAFRGVYVTDEGEEVRIGRTKVRADNEVFSLKQEGFQLRQKGERYFWNSRSEEGDSFVFRVFKLQGDSGISFGGFELNGPEDRAVIEAITPVLKWDGGTYPCAKVNPDDEVFEELLKCSLMKYEFLRRVK